jgi:hypothetical protein
MQQSGLEEELTRRSVTHSAWDLSSSKDRKRRGWHPVTYKVSDATPALIKSIKVHFFFRSSVPSNLCMHIYALKKTKSFQDHLDLNLICLNLIWSACLQQPTVTKMAMTCSLKQQMTLLKKSNKEGMA